MTDKKTSRTARQVAGRAARAGRRLVQGEQRTDEPSSPTAPAVPAPSVDGEPSEAEIELLRSSVLFDHDWYNRQVRVERKRRAAVRHYLVKGAARGFSPHPLFDPSYFLDQLDEETRAAIAGRDPLVAYLRRRMYAVRTHPLFDVRAYRRRHPTAKDHRAGPLGHYVEVGAQEGLRPNGWLPVEPLVEPLVEPDVEPDLADVRTRYPDLVQWVLDRYAEAERRRPPRMPARVPERDPGPGDHWLAVHGDTRPKPVPERPDEPLVTVVLDAGVDRDLLERSLASLRAQTLASWELVAVDRARIAELGAVLGDVEQAGGGPDVPVHLVAHQRRSDAATVDEAVRRARGRYLAFLDAGDTWVPERLAHLVGALEDAHGAVALDQLEVLHEDGHIGYAVHPPRPRLLVRQRIDVARVVLRRSTVDEVGGIDHGLLGAWALDLVARVQDRGEVVEVPLVGTSRVTTDRAEAFRPVRGDREPLDHAEVGSWQDVVLNRHLVDWAALRRRRQQPGTVTVIIPTYEDWRLTTTAVRTVAEADVPDGTRVECLVLDNGSAPSVSVVLESLPHRFPGTRVVHAPVNYGFALGNNVALAEAQGELVVFLNNDTAVPRDWLRPLLDALEDPEVLGAQSLLVYPTGTVQSAGVAFPAMGGLPHALLQGHPVEDAEAVRDLRLNALTGAALAVRWSDAVAMRGFDPLFTNGMEDVDLCQRLAEHRPGYFRVVVDAPVTHFESMTPGRYEYSLLNRRLWLQRWRGKAEPRDEVDLYLACGFQVIGHQVARTHDDQDPTVSVSLPVLARPQRLRLREVPTSLRWAIKNPAPPGALGDQWGDTHFAEALARGLRSIGQEVVIDRRPAYERSTSHHDDVALVLRGLARHRPFPEHVSIAWVISHPDMFSRGEAQEFDVVAAASSTWAREKSSEWGRDVETLLQATDPSRFHPDSAVPDTGHPVLFVGSSRMIDRRIVRDAVEGGLPLSVYGRHWRPFLDGRYLKGEYLDNRLLSASYRSAGVVLNDHWDDMRSAGFYSNRLFDAVAAGARVVSDDVPGLDDLFGRSVQVYRSPADLTRLTSLADPDTVFGPDEERRARAARVAAEHSFEARARELVDLAMHARARRGFDA